MAVLSQNGWTGNDRSVIRTWTVPGTTTRVALRDGDCGLILTDLAAWFHRNVEPIDRGQPDDWGYAERPIRGGVELSNHASGTAIDLNATRHPLGRSGTFTAAQAARIRSRLRVYGGVVRWGGDYSGRVDEMHFEINAGSAAVARVASSIRAGRITGGTNPDHGPAKPKEWDEMATQKQVQDAVRGVVREEVGRALQAYIAENPNGAVDEAGVDDLKRRGLTLPAVLRKMGLVK